MKSGLIYALIFVFFGWSATAQSPYFQWDTLPSLPAINSKTPHPGLAGAFSGSHNDVFILAGGANFPKAKPWEGGEKVWHDEIYILQKKADESAFWNPKTFRLPRPLAYGASLSTKEGLMVIGGCDSEQCYADVYLLSWDNKSNHLNIRELPHLPKPLAFMGGAEVEGTMYLAGGQSSMKNPSATRKFFAFDTQDPGAQWEVLPAWDGPERILPVVAGQGDGLTNCFYLFSGRNIQANEETAFLSDAYRYHPIKKKWKRLADIQIGQDQKQCVMGGNGLGVGAAQVLVFGGDNGKVFKKIEACDRQAKQNPDKADSLLRIKERMLVDHLGFSKQLLSYHTITNTWTDAGKIPAPSPVTTQIARWGEDIILPSGEIRPGVRSPQVLRMETIPGAKDFGWANYAVLILYFLALLYIGWHFSKRQKTVTDYFKGGGRVPWWAAGLSIFGTVLSAISFMAIPAKTFATDWSYLMYNLGPFMIAPLVIAFFLPFYQGLNITTVYEYLEKRFNVLIRLLGSIAFMVYQFGRIAIVLYLPAIAINIVTGADILLSIAIVGLISVAYTMMGGIEGVIWTDVLQVFVLMGGALMCLGLIAWDIEGGLAGIYQTAIENHKFNIIDLRWDLNEPTFIVVLMAGIFSNLVFYGTDQTVAQRYLTASDAKGAAKSVWTNAIMVLPTTLLFFFMGTTLYAYYTSQPEALHPALEATDAIFPWYIITELPPGLSGLLIAGVFAASMSSLSSSMNSVATAYTIDFHQRFHWKGDLLKIARNSTLVIGLIGTIFAMLMATWDIKSLWDEFLKVIGLVTGGLGGVFVLGIMSKRAHGTGALIGLLGSSIIQFFVAQSGIVHLLLFTATGFLSCILIGFAASIFLPGEDKEIDRLTWHTLNRKKEE